MSVINILSMNRLNAYADARGVYTLIGCTGCPLRCAVNVMNYIQMETMNYLWII